MKNNIRAIRVARGLSMADLASAAKISFPYLTNLESTTRKKLPVPGLDKARRLAKALGASLEELFPEEQ